MKEKPFAHYHKACSALVKLCREKIKKGEYPFPSIDEYKQQLQEIPELIPFPPSKPGAAFTPTTYEDVITRMHKWGYIAIGTRNVERIEEKFVIPIEGIEKLLVQK